MIDTVIKTAFGIISESFTLLAEMAPYLLLGFLFAGILSEFISADKIGRHLGKGNLTSVFKAALLGMPLPLCSCGVIPTTMALRKNGASRGAVLSFLISTPTTGVDSIFATYSLLGPLFAGYRVLASLVAGVFSGVVANLFGPDQTADRPSGAESSVKINSSKRSLSKKGLAVLHYAYVELFEEIAKWLFIGIFIGGVLTYLIPDAFFATYLSHGWQAILLMLVIGIPLYVCATGSIPIAAALMLKGINPGAAFVFLLAGPATNAVTITVIGKYLGTRSSIIYLLSIAVSSVGLAVLLDKVWLWFGVNLSGGHMVGHEMSLNWLKIAAAIIILLLTLFPIISKKSPKLFTRKTKPLIGEIQSSVFTVPNMTCKGCSTKVQAAVNELEGIGFIAVDLQTKKVQIDHARSTSNTVIAKAIRSAGYNVE